MPDRPSLSDEFEQLRRFHESNFRVHPAKAAQDRAHTAVSEFNAWMERQVVRIQESDRRLAEREKEIARALQKGDVRRHNRLVDSLQQAISDHNIFVESYNHELDTRNQATEQAIEQANETVEWYAAWRRDEGPERFSEELNRFFATLKRAERRGTGDPREIRLCLDAAREMRAELFDWAVHPDQDPDGSDLVVPATLDGGEDVYLLVDTGANTVTLSPEMVEALGLEAHLGGEVEVRLVAGLSTMARTLVVPSIRVHDRTEHFVRALAMDVPGAGVDGCLGMSFLNRFEFSVQGEPDRELVLTPRMEIAGTAEGPDVFISHGHETDPEIPGAVFRRLTDAGRRPFWASQLIGKANQLASLRAVDTALETARHLIVICSSREDLDSGWFAAEWRLFERRLEGESETAGSSIVPLLIGEMTADELPDLLRRFPAVTWGDPDWAQTVLDLLDD